MRPTLASTTRTVSLVLSAVAIGSVGLLSGCEDSEANARQQASATIAEQSRKLEAASLASDTAALQSVVSALNGVKGADGQQAAAALLASSANRKLAVISMTEAADLENEARDLQSLLLAQADAAVELGQVLEGLASIDPAPQTSQLDQQRSAASASLREYSNEMAELDQPINELSAARRDGIARAEQLRQEANELLRRAAQMSYSDGFSSYQQGVETRRQADIIEYQVVRTELELNYDHEARHRMASTQAQNAQALITSIEKSKRDLNTMHSELRQQIQASGRKFDELVTSINSGLQTLQNMRGGAIAAAYEQAIAYADAAAAKARSAATKARGQADAAKAAHARAAEVKGRIYAQQLAGLEEQAILLQRLIDASSAISGNFQSALDATNNQIQQVRQMAIDAFTEARDAAQGISGRDTQQAIQSFVSGLNRAITSLGGQAMSDPDPAAGS